MTREEFFEKFDLFAELPDAVAKMRSLILSLASMGRLVEDADQSASGRETLARIIAIRQRAFPSKSDSNRLEAAPIAAGDTHALPGHWARTTIGEVCLLQTGATPSRTEPSYFKGDIRWLVSGDINKREILECDARISESALENSNCKLIPPNSVLIALNGQGKTRATVAMLRVAAALNQSLVAMSPFAPDLLLPEFIYWNLRGRYIAIRDITGAEQRRGLNMKLVGQLTLPMPPTDEQQQIVSKLDELMALCDRLEAQQKERGTRHTALARASLSRFADAPTPATLTFLCHKSYAIPPADLRKSILTLAVQGRLVPQDPSDESASHWLSRVGLASTVLLNGEDRGNDSLRVSWEWVRFDDVALVAGGLTLGRKLGTRAAVTLPYLRVANVKRGELDLSVIKEVAIPADEIERYALRKNDLLMTEGGDWDKVGRAAIWQAEIPLCLHQNHVFRARMRSTELSALWFERYFNSPNGRGYFEAASKQTTNLASINMRQVRNCPVPLPPVAEQRRIVAKVDQLMALVDALETQLATSRTTAAKLLDAIVAELAA